MLLKSILPLFLLIFVSFLDAASIAKEKPATCGYESCPKPDPNKLNIHIVAHSHDDVGWLKTVDQYYYGSHSMIQKAGVQYIIDSSIEALQKDSKRRFIQVETAFFWRWWKDQDEATRDVVRYLVNEGRLEIIGGGWSMADEAVTHYHSLVDQYTWGFRRLNDTLGTCARPRIGWQIDPFGHSREQASIFAQLGFDGYFFGRLDWNDKTNRLKEKKAEFIWKGSPSLGKKADIFTGILFNNYSPPPGYCFDFLCADEPIIDDVESPDYNVDRRVELLLAFCQIQARSYKTNNVILTMGDDFNYQYAEMWFINLEKLIRYTNERNGSEFNMFYSTPSCYLKALHEQNLTWTTKSDDFFPYASDPHAFWTGYFTSRPTLKYFERLGNNFLQITKQLSALSNDHTTTKYLEEFREAMGTMQHHDAVTGTEKQKVADDYARILHKSFVHGHDIASIGLNTLMNPDKHKPQQKLAFYSCLSLNVSSCEHTEKNKNFVVTIYNPTSQDISFYVRLPVLGNSYSVKDNKGHFVKTQVVPIAEAVLNIPGRVSEAQNELVFHAVDIPALGFQSYYISRNTNIEDNVEIESKKLMNIDNEKFNVIIDEFNNLNIQGPNNLVINSTFHFYEGAEGNNMVFENRSSGAYIFRPRIEHAERFNNSSASQKIYDGPLVKEIHWKLNEWVSAVVRMYTDTKFVEYDWTVGPIPIDDKIGKEIIIRYSTNLKTDGLFYTDSNGREMIQRKRNYRPTWNVELKEPVAGNYYPVTNKIYIQDKESGNRVAVLTDRAQGGSSLADGEIELMVHRRLLRDDAFGVQEPLNETAYGKGLVVTGQHYIVFGNAKNDQNVVQKEKSLTMQLALKPWLMFTPMTDISYEEYNKTYPMRYAGFTKKLPENVHVLTLEPWKDDTILLRLEHLYEVGESPQLSQPVKVNIQDLFAAFNIVSIKETTLGGNQLMEEMNRLKWNSESNDVLTEEEDVIQPVFVENNAINVVLKPMEIRTFIVKVSRG